MKKIKITLNSFPNHKLCPHVNKKGTIRKIKKIKIPLNSFPKHKLCPIDGNSDENSWERHSCM